MESVAAPHQNIEGQKGPRNFFFLGGVGGAGEQDPQKSVFTTLYRNMPILFLIASTVGVANWGSKTKFALPCYGKGIDKSEMTVRQVGVSQIFLIFY